jgi:hypothetical protein
MRTFIVAMRTAQPMRANMGLSRETVERAGVEQLRGRGRGGKHARRSAESVPGSARAGCRPACRFRGGPHQLWWMAHEPWWATVSPVFHPRAELGYSSADIDGMRFARSGCVCKPICRAAA